MLSAEFAGMQQAGNALQGVGDTLEKHAIAKETHITEGQLAGEKMFRDGVDSDISNFATDNPGDANALEEFSKKRWETYETERSTRISDEGWSNMAVDADNTENTFDKKRSQIAVSSAVTGIRIEEANKRKANRASQLIQSDRLDEAIAVVKTMSLSEADKKSEITEIFATSFKQRVTDELSVAGSMEPALAAQAYADIADRLDDLDEYTTTDGGLARDDRYNLLDAARKRTIHFDKLMNSNGAELARRIAAGDPVIILQDALDNNLVTRETLLGLSNEFGDAQQVAESAKIKERSDQVNAIEQTRSKLFQGSIDAEQIEVYLDLGRFTEADAVGLRKDAIEIAEARSQNMEEVLDKKIREERAKQINKRDSISAGISQNKVSLKDIAEQESLLQITTQDAKELRDKLVNVIGPDQMRGEEFLDLERKINREKYQFMITNSSAPGEMGMVTPGMASDNSGGFFYGQPEMSTLQDLQREISTGNFTPEVKRVLIGKILTIISLDRKDLQQEEPKNLLFDRSFTKEENFLVDNLHIEYLKSDQDPEAIGSMIFRHEDRVRNFFDDNPDVTQDRIDKFQKELINEIIGKDLLSILLNQ